MAAATQKASRMPKKEETMKNILLKIEYDGTDFHGWQKQPGRRTVQGELEKVLGMVCNTEISLNGTSRTDAGVHALGQQASFKAYFGIPVDRIMLAANNLLVGGRNSLTVGDVRIKEVTEMPPDFHARYDAKGKTYRYKILNQEELSIFSRNYCYQVRQPLNDDAMRKAAAHMVGTHDFRCFQAAGSEERATTIRTIKRIDIARDGDLLQIEVTGDGFLYNMVRIITGTLVEAGLGKRDPEKIPYVLDSLDRGRAGHTAPPQGLYLARVYYDVI